MSDVRLVVVGAGGRMGSRVLHLASEQQGWRGVGAIEREGHPDLGKEIMPGLRLSCDLQGALEGCDVLIDFSSPLSSLAAAKAANASKVAAVIGTTGFSPKQVQEIQCICADIPWILAPNMSLGVAVMAKLVRDAASLLGEEYEIEIIETHHRNKLDAPSGTAKMLAKTVCEARGWREEDALCCGREGRCEAPRPAQLVGVHALRGGQAIGEHRVFFLGPGEVLEVAHRAETRDTFVLGALRGAMFLVGKKPGRYEITDALMNR